MLIARWIFLLLGVAAIISFGLYIGTGQARYRRAGLAVVRWSVVAGLVFFAMLAVERLVSGP